MNKIDEPKRQLMEMKDWKKVTKEEFVSYINQYKDKYDVELCKHSVYFCSPPMHGNYDFSLNPFDSDATVCNVARMIEGWYGSEDTYYVVCNVDEIKEWLKVQK